MVFSSMQFVLLFFIINIIVQAAAPDMRAKNLVMLAFSLVFYTWAGLRYVLLLLFMVFVSWAGALLLQQYKQWKKPIFTATVAISLLVLGIFKYTGFFLQNVQLLTGFPSVIPEIALPLGISFYTFQLISYVADVYRGEVTAQTRYWLLLLYAGMFHQCVAGPIVRYQDIQRDIAHRTVQLQELSRGITRFSVGLAKKALLANYCAELADSLLAADSIASVPMLSAWLGCFAYMLQIYLDFSAYSDMAIGMGLMSGFHYRENFNYPYIANSVTDFWRRWHISLSSFFRDYVYIPLGGNRCSVSRHIVNMLIVWALTGLWHGASWNFVLWGLYYFVFLILEKYWLSDLLSSLHTALRHVLTLIIVYFGWVLFRVESMGELGHILAGMFGVHGLSSYAAGLTLKNNFIFLLIACAACTPLAVTCGNILHSLANRYSPCRWIQAVFDILLPVLLLVLALASLAGDSYNPFLYFNF